MQLKTLHKKGPYPKWKVLVILFIFISAFAGAQNIITNPGFETADGSGWTGTFASGSSASFYDVTSAGEIHGGARARASWMNSGATSEGTLKQTKTNVTAGTYTASIWTRRENYATAFEFARLRVLNGGTQIASANLPSGGSYANTTISNITVPGGATINFQIEFKVPGGNAYITIDDASFTLTSGGSTVATPTFSPGTGTYSSTQPVSISSATSGATIYYTTDGNNPTTASSVYSSAISVTSTKTIKAIAAKSGMTTSGIGSATITISAGGATNYYVAPAPTGNNSNSGLSGSPWASVSYAANQVAGGVGHTINVAAGTYSESSPVVLKPKVNLVGAGQGTTIITKSGSYDVSDTNFDSPTGSLIQLVSNPLPSASIDGGQTISNFKVDGASRTVKAGVWVQNRSNVTMTNVTITNTNFRGAVFSPGYKDFYIEPQYYMTGINVNNCTFTNTSKDVYPGSDQSLGALCISGLDGATIHTITINENQGYGIKFIYDGYFKNCTVRDCNITVPETDARWGEDISLELWNFGTNNRIYNITCNTWLSLVNHALGPFNNTTYAGEYLKVYGIKMIDGNASSGKEAVECALQGVEIYNSYFQNKGFGIAIWDAGGKNVTVRNNTFYNSAAQSSWASGAVYIDNSTGRTYSGINVYNNIFDGISNAVNIVMRSGGISGVNIKNNAFLNGTNGNLASSGSNISNIVFTNNLRNSGTWSITGATTNSANVIGAPGYQSTGNRYDNAYYAPSSASSFAVAKGTNVGLPYSGTAPDIGRYEWTGGGGRQTTSEVNEELKDESSISSYPNPTTGLIRITSAADTKIEGVQVMNLQGKTILNKLVSQLNNVDIDLSQQPNDIYIFRVKHQRGVITKKVVLMK